MDWEIRRYIELMGRRHKKFFAMAREGLLKIGAPAAKALVQVLLTHKNSFIRRHAAVILGELGEKGAIGPLIRALDDRMPAVRWSAAIALGLLKDQRAVPMLKRQLKSTIWQLRVNAAVSLGWIGDDRALRPLLSLLVDRNRLVRRAAAFALAKLDRSTVREELMRALFRGAFPSVEAALGLTFVGELQGYFTLASLPPTMIWKLPRLRGEAVTISGRGAIPERPPPRGRGGSKPVPQKRPLPRKEERKIREALALGHLFARSEVYAQAAHEYRGALAACRPVPSRWAAVLLNDLGCMFRAMGHLEQGYFFFSLAHRLDAKRREVRENFGVAEALMEMREIIMERIQHYLKIGDLSLPGTRGYLQELYRILLPGREDLSIGSLEEFRTAHVALRSFFGLGYRVYQAFSAFRGEEEPSFSVVPPIEFLEEQLPEMELLFRVEEPFVMYRELLVLLMDRFRKNLLMQQGKYRELEGVLGVELIDSIFLRGFFVGFLEKIWRVLHQPISLN